MSSLTVALIAFACFCAGTWLGSFLYVRLPKHHLSDDSRDVVKLGAGLLATLAALVLGLLVSGAKSQFDAATNNLREGTARRVELDRVLARYGPEATATRQQLKDAATVRVASLRPELDSAARGLKAAEALAKMEMVGDSLRALAPVGEPQRLLKARALDVYHQGNDRLWFLAVNNRAQSPTAFIVVLVVWFTALFILFAMLSAKNWTLRGTQLVCAFSVAAGIFLVLEMNHPFEGIIRISVEPMEAALRLLGQ